jgi:hypothetical protein
MESLRRAKAGLLLASIVTLASAQAFGFGSKSPATPAPAPSVAPNRPLTFGIAGDAGAWNSNAQAAQASMIKLGVSRLILPGDNLYDEWSGNYNKPWDPWVAKGFTFDAVAIGNHNAGYAKEMAYFKMPSEYFSVTHKGQAKFIVLNSDNDKTAAAQAAFLEREIKNSSEPLIFTVFHHPSYTVSADHSWDEKKNFQLAVRKVIWANRSKLTALIVGHDHLASLIHFNDLPVILSGAIQDVRNDVMINNVQDGVSVKGAFYFEGVPYWARLKITKDKPNEATVDFIRSSDSRISCTARLAPGRKADLDQNCLKFTAEREKQLRAAGRIAMR